MDLFDYKARQVKRKEAPLADRVRPDTIDSFVGQREVVGEGSVLRQLLENDEISSMILWGPPGTGKTTLARIIAYSTSSRFVQLSAVSSGVADLRKVVAEADEFLKMHETRTIVFVDEIHRWNKAQQDAFLPHVENGTVTLIGATTENPSFEVNAALLSRCRVVVLLKLEVEDIARLLERALCDEKQGFGGKDIKVDDGVVTFLAGAADGDARAALNALELAVKSTPEKARNGEGKVIHLTKEVCVRSLRRSHIVYDRSGEGHFNIISALHKSMRGSDIQASLYWLGRMLEGGESPLYVARRLMRFASEDIGLADPQALVQANAAFQAAHQLGMPECDVALAQATVYLAKAPKSNALYVAYKKVQHDVWNAPNDPVPLHLRNASTALMKDLGYGRDYIYSHDDPDAPQDFLPDRLRGKGYYEGP